MANHLLTVFGDVILLNTKFCITGAGRLIAATLNYFQDELVGKHVSAISSGPDFESFLREQLEKDVFENQEYSLMTAGGHVLSVSLSGFYVSGMGEAAGRVLLRVKDIVETRLIDQQIEEKNQEMEHFLFLASHDLRGPLATILGLVHVSLLETVPPEQVLYLREILKYAEKLDDTLGNLMCIASSEHMVHEYSGALNIDKVENLLRDVVRHHGGDQIEFTFKVDQLKVRQVNDIDLMALLKNVLIAFLGLPKQMPQQQIVVLITALKSHILINVFANGFRMDDGMEEKFRRTNPSCSEAVHSSNLVHFYVARKIVSKLRGSLEASLSEKNQHLFIRIPLIEKKSAGTRS